MPAEIAAHSPEWYEPPADAVVECVTCGGRISESIEIFGGPELFCCQACLEEWILDNAGEAARRLRTSP